MSKYNTGQTHWDWLHASASFAVKEELRQMESKPNSFVSIQTVLSGKSGQPVKTYPQTKPTRKFY